MNSHEIKQALSALDTTDYDELLNDGAPLLHAILENQSVPLLWHVLKIAHNNGMQQATRKLAELAQHMEGRARMRNDLMTEPMGEQTT